MAAKKKVKDEPAFAHQTTIWAADRIIAHVWWPSGNVPVEMQILDSSLTPGEKMEAARALQLQFTLYSERRPSHEYCFQLLFPDLENPPSDRRG